MHAVTCFWPLPWASMAPLRQSSFGTIIRSLASAMPKPMPSSHDSSHGYAASSPTTPSSYSATSSSTSSAQMLNNATSSGDTVSRELMNDIMACSMKRQTGVSLRYILEFGIQPLERQMLLSARFLASELPIRLAHRIMDLNQLPPAMVNSIHVQRARKWYAQSFQEIREFPTIKDEHDVARFTQMLKGAYSRHANVVPAIAKGVEEYKRTLANSRSSADLQPDDLHTFLDNFFMSRIALRFLAGNHIALYEQAISKNPPVPDRIGLIHTKCCPLQIVRLAVEDARDICLREKGDAPDVTIHGNPQATFPYVPSHLHHMTFELVKNSLRAVHERFDALNQPPPPINVVVAAGMEDVTIKVSDQGGGISRSGVHRIWTYLYTTAKSPLPEVSDDDDGYSALPAVLAGYGCGLPLSRLYARYFGGEMQIFSMQGHGTDAFLHLSRLGNDEEPLPGQGSTQR